MFTVSLKIVTYVSIYILMIAIGYWVVSQFGGGIDEDRQSLLHVAITRGRMHAGRVQVGHQLGRRVVLNCHLL